MMKDDLPLYRGRESLASEEEFLLTGLVPKTPDKAKKYGFIRRACKYKKIGDTLYMQGDDLVLRRVRWKEELYRVLEENHEGAYKRMLIISAIPVRDARPLERGI